MDRYSSGSTIVKGIISDVHENANLTKDEINKNEEISKPITKEEAKEKKEVSLKEIDDKFMTIDDFLDNFD